MLQKRSKVFQPYSQLSIPLCCTLYFKERFGIESCCHQRNSSILTGNPPTERSTVNGRQRHEEGPGTGQDKSARATRVQAALSRATQALCTQHSNTQTLEDTDTVEFRSCDAQKA